MPWVGFDEHACGSPSPCRNRKPFSLFCFGSSAPIRTSNNGSFNETPEAPREECNRKLPRLGKSAAENSRESRGRVQQKIPEIEHQKGLDQKLGFLV